MHLQRDTMKVTFKPPTWRIHSSILVPKQKKREKKTTKATAHNWNSCNIDKWKQRQEPRHEDKRIEKKN